MEPIRKEDGDFASTITDEALWELYESHAGSTKNVARESGLSLSQVKKRLAKIRNKMGAIHAGSIDHAGKFEAMVASIPTVGPAGARLSEASVRLYGIGAKDQLTQQIVTQGMESVGAKYRFDTSPADLDLFLPRESKIHAYVADGIRCADTERLFVIGDAQLGFWKVRDERDPQKFRLEPFHDEAAIDCMMQALALYAPDRVIIIGDFLDFPQLSRFQQEPGYRGTLQASVCEAEQLIAKIRVTAGEECRIDFIPGNHETRLTRAIVNNNEELFGLTRPGEKHPLYSIPSLLNFEKYNVECAAEYPSGEVWLASRRGSIPALVATHADPKKKELRADAIHGHLVLPSMETRQVFYEDGPVTYTRICISGTANYSDTSDKVRLTRTQTPSGRARMAAVQSFGTVDIDRETGLRHYGVHLVNHGRTHFCGRVITSLIQK